MENITYNELCYRGFSVDVGIAKHSIKTVEDKSQRVQQEVDFVANREAIDIISNQYFKFLTKLKENKKQMFFLELMILLEKLLFETTLFLGMMSLEYFILRLNNSCLMRLRLIYSLENILKHTMCD